MGKGCVAMEKWCIVMGKSFAAMEKRCYSGNEARCNRKKEFCKGGKVLLQWKKRCVAMGKKVLLQWKGVLQANRLRQGNAR